MTNNYFKVYHYMSVLGLSVDEKAIFFFFDDKDRASTLTALRAAEECVSTIAALTFGRRLQLSVYARLPSHPRIHEVGEVMRLSTYMSARH